MKLATFWFWAGAHLTSSLETGKYVDVGNHACPANTTALASKAECAEAAEMIWPKGGCYSQPWKAIVKSLPDGSAYPTGCIYDVSEGGGCALLLQTDGKAKECQEGMQCHVLCRHCIAVGEPCNISHNDCCEDQTGTPMQCVSMGEGPVCISGISLLA
mmetsp:Transcript_14378/g.16768  ORF Transcript_14378/g.16768 Transcript_14378/m.16768 type:complete len:158 (+) Transcript_14378:72-545(+)|eukprot:Skav226629  [mRNA]  locus=scaffold2041:511304:514957:+ [translate_table: standard]